MLESILKWNIHCKTGCKDVILGGLSLYVGMASHTTSQCDQTDMAST